MLTMNDELEAAAHEMPSKDWLGPKGPLTAVDLAKAEATVINLNLTVAEQRKVVEHMAGGSCFRMRITNAEWSVLQGQVPSWQFCTLKDGSRAMWQPYSELQALKRGPRMNHALYENIRSKIIADTVE